MSGGALQRQRSVRTGLNAAPAIALASLALAGCTGLTMQSGTDSALAAQPASYPVCTRGISTRIRSLDEDRLARCLNASLAEIR